MYLGTFPSQDKHQSTDNQSPTRIPWFGFSIMGKVNHFKGENDNPGNKRGVTDSRVVGGENCL